jgi:hypothetical protein
MVADTTAILGATLIAAAAMQTARVARVATWVEAHADMLAGRVDMLAEALADTLAAHAVDSQAAADTSRAAVLAGAAVMPPAAGGKLNRNDVLNAHPFGDGRFVYG